MTKTLGFLVLGVLLLASPVFATGPYNDPSYIQTQIIALQAQIQTLLAQIAALQPQSGAASWQKGTCPILTRNLIIGSSSDGHKDDEVFQLQWYLADQGFFTGKATGYYGNLTAQAVRNWQKAHGMDFVTLKSGVGPMTRAKIVESCGGQSGNQPALKTYSQTFTDTFEGYGGPYTYGVDYDPTKFVITKASDNSNKFYVTLAGYAMPDVTMSIEYVYLGNFGGSLLQYWEGNAKSRLCPTCTEIVKPNMSTIEKAYIDNITGASKSNTAWLLMNNGSFIVSGDVDYFYPVLKTLRIIQ